MNYKRLSEEDDLTLLKELRISSTSDYGNIAMITFIILLFHFGYTILAWIIMLLSIIGFIIAVSLPSKLLAIKTELKKRGYK